MDRVGNVSLGLPFLLRGTLSIVQVDALSPRKERGSPLPLGLLFPEPWMLGRVEQTGPICWMRKGSTERSMYLAKFT